jgi:hypothetical protein
VVCGVIITVMRRQKAWINMVAMLALLIGAIPGSVFASLFSATNCEMPCCVGKPVHQPNDEMCAKGCDDSPSGHHSKSESRHTEHASVVKRSDSGCECSLSSAPPPSQPVVAVTVPNGFGSHTVDAVLTTGFVVRPVICELRSNPGIFGSDSGPPVSRPKYASLGRAPPVLLA